MMNKRKFMLGVIFMGFLLGVVANYSYAEETYTEADMKAVTVRFCGEGTGASTHDGVYYVAPEKDQNIRLCVTNAGKKKVGFEYGFSESGIGNGRYCQGDIGTGNKFSILIPWTKQRKIIIEPMSEQIIEERIVIPAGMSGLQLGCIGYNLTQPENTMVGGMFSLKIRKVGYMDIMIGGESDVKSSIKILNLSGGVFSTNKKVKAEVDDANNLKLTFLIENEGNISQNITITGRVTNALGFQQPFTATVKTVAPGSTNTFVIDAGILPSYKGFFTVSYNVQSDPQFMFPVSDEKLKQPSHIADSGKIFIFSWIWVVVGVVLLLILYKLFVPRRAKPVTETATV